MNDSDNAWNWQVWKYKERKGGGKDLLKWVGFFFNEKDAFAWINGRKGYVVNNVGPAALRGPAEKTVKVEEPKFATSERRPRLPANVFHGAPRAKPKRALTAEERRLQKEAAVVLEQHKQDEAVELAAAEQG